MPPPHPLEPYLATRLALLEGLWIDVRYPRTCPHHKGGCRSSLALPLKFVLAERRAPPEMVLSAFLRRIVCRVCRSQPEALAIMDRGDGRGWRLEVPMSHWRKPMRG